jgi:ABC-type thiamin/hydroxymethylpyrimidine transport system permease subunit
MKLSIGNFFLKFSVFDLVVMAMVASLGIAIKPVIVPLVHMITGPLFIPGGAVAGGFYMMWIVVGSGIVGKKGAASLIALVQAVMVIAIGVFGTHGIMSLVTYLAPGIAVDIFLLAARQKNRNIASCFFAGMIANVAGTVLTNFVFFKLPWIPLVLTLTGGALSGGLGGLLAYSIIKGFSKINISRFRISGKLSKSERNRINKI